MASQQKTTYNLEESIEWWKESAGKDLADAEEMLEKHRDWALFIGQLALEKLLKGLVIKKTNKTPPYIHELAKLAMKAGVSLTLEQLDDLNQISRFNMEARYPEVKRSLYDLASVRFAKI